MLWTIIVIIFILWLLGFFGHRVYSGFPQTGGWIHTLIVIAIILVVLHLLGYFNPRPLLCLDEISQGTKLIHLNDFLNVSQKVIENSLFK